MNYQNLKKYVVGFALMVAFVLVPGLAGVSTAQAQGYGDPRWGRWENRDRDWQRDRYDDRYGRNSAYNRDVEKGYHDGLDRGREDARDRRNPTPNNSSHYRNGNSAYREGFRRGYEEGYRQYARNRRW